MKKLFFAITALLALVANDLFSQSIAVYFEVIPEHILMQLDPNRRKDMIDMFQAGRPATAKTRFGGTAEVIALTDNYLKIELSKSSMVEMAMLGDTAHYIGVIRTVCAPACDSEIEFYTTTWEPITDINIAKPLLENFLVNKIQPKETWDGGRNINYRERTITEADKQNIKRDHKTVVAETPDSELNNNTSTVTSNEKKRDINEIIDFVPVRYEFIIEEGKPIKQIKASNSIKEMMSDKDFDLIKSKILQSVNINIVD